jgi:hypothetical protein
MERPVPADLVRLQRQDQMQRLRAFIAARVFPKKSS